MIRQYVVFGKYAIDCVFDEDWSGLNEVFEDTPNSIGYREFNTEEERMAYICGLEDMAGWMESCPLTDEEVSKMEGEIRLSDIDDLKDRF